MPSYKLVKDYKGIKAGHTFIVRQNQLVCILPFNGEIIFPMSVLNDGDYFVDTETSNTTNILDSVPFGYFIMDNSNDPIWPPNHTDNVSKRFFINIEHAKEFAEYLLRNNSSRAVSICEVKTIKYYPARNGGGCG